jgi:HD-GYP domain-containing protein (c-di-GMP phosphodiesterase class II)
MSAMVSSSVARCRARVATGCFASWFRGCSRRRAPHTSGVSPIFEAPLRLAEFVATLALAQDNAFGQPLESQLRSCLLASWICEAAGVQSDVREDAYWVALLRYVGCTGHAHEVATVFGDEIAIRAQTLVHDAANPTEVMGDVVAFATAGRSDDERDEIIRMLQETAHEWAVHNFASGCEVADMLVHRLDFGDGVRDALAYTFERWNGKGFPAHAEGEAIPLAMRVVHLSHDMEAIGRLFSPDRAIGAARDRRDRTYDPKLADLFVAHGRSWFDRLGETDPWDAVLALEPEPRRILEGEDLDRALVVAADFIDLKSPYMGGHSRRCAQLATDAAQVLGQPEEAVAMLRRAALVHDFGTTAVPNSIWDKPGPLTRTEFDRVELHTMLTEQMLRRSPALTVLNSVACTHHEKCDGSGYHKRTRADTGDPAACLLAATEIYVGLTTERADRPPHSDAAAAVELRRLETEGMLEPRATRAVLVAAGHGEPTARTRKRPENPGGLSRREVDVLGLAARGLTTREIADRLVISPKTADHHIQHIYGKIGVSTRAAAALWAMQHDVVR